MQPNDWYYGHYPPPSATTKFSIRTTVVRGRHAEAVFGDVRARHGVYPKEIRSVQENTEEPPKGGITPCFKNREGKLFYRMDLGGPIMLDGPELTLCEIDKMTIIVPAMQVAEHMHHLSSIAEAAGVPGVVKVHGAYLTLILSVAEVEDLKQRFQAIAPEAHKLSVIEQERVRGIFAGPPGRPRGQA